MRCHCTRTYAVILLILSLLLTPRLSFATTPEHCRLEHLDVYQETTAFSDQITGSNASGYWFKGNANINSPTFRLQANQIFSAPDKKYYKALDNVYLGTDQLRVWGTSATFQADTSATINHGVLSTCIGSKDQLAWSLEANKIVYDRKKQNVSAYHTTLKFFKVPIFYSPYVNVSFVRRSGLLPPSIGSYQFMQPGTTSFTRNQFLALGLYLNLAPNYDAFIYPTWLENRGVHTEGKFRYLTQSGKGTFEFGVLPNDPVLNTPAINDKNLYRLSFTNQTVLSQYTKLTTDLSLYSPRTYYTLLPRINGQALPPSKEDRLIELSHNQGKHQLSIKAKDTLSLTDKTLDGYQLIPQIHYNYQWVAPPNNNRINLTSQFTVFRSPESRTTQLIEGQRLVFNPSWHFDKPIKNLYFSSVIGAYVNQYHLKQPNAFNRTDQQFSNLYSHQGVDVFFNNTPDFLAKNIRATLIPSVHYIYVPYVDQSQVPNFDASLYRITQLQQLYNPLEYSGYDRISEANRSVISITQEAFHFESELFLQLSMGRNLDIVKPREQRSNSAVFEDWFIQSKMDLQRFHLSVLSQWEEQLKEHHYWSANALYEAPIATWRLNLLNDQSSSTVSTNYASVGVDSSVGQHWRIGLLANYNVDQAFVQRYALGASFDDCCWQANISIDGSNTLNEQFEVYQLKIELIFKGLLSLGDKGARTELFNLSQGF